MSMQRTYLLCGGEHGGKPLAPDPDRWPSPSAHAETAPDTAGRKRAVGPRTQARANARREEESPHH